jgi:hypothetical protein
VDLACTNPEDNRNLADRRESVFLDIRAGFPILKALFLAQPLTSFQEDLNAETPENVPNDLLAEGGVLLGDLNFPAVVLQTCHYEHKFGE